MKLTNITVKKLNLPLLKKRFNKNGKEKIKRVMLKFSEDVRVCKKGKNQNEK